MWVKISKRIVSNVSFLAKWPFQYRKCNLHDLLVFWILINWKTGCIHTSNQHSKTFLFSGFSDPDEPGNLVLPSGLNQEAKTFVLTPLTPSYVVWFSNKCRKTKIRFFWFSWSGWTRKPGASIQFQPGGQDLSFNTLNTLLAILVL